MNGKQAIYRGDKTFEIAASTAIAPEPTDIQIQVAYCGICGTDLHIFQGHMDARVGFDRSIGHEMSGTVSAIGRDVQGFSVGDPIVVRPLDHCGDCSACDAGHTHICHNLKFLGIDTPGAFQTHWTVPAHTVHHVPSDLSLLQAALVEPMAVACHDVKRARVARGENVLVIGAGPIGLLVAFAAREAGGNVFVSEVNPNRLAYAQSQGFQTFNPSEQDVPALVQQSTNNAGMDVVFEVSGTQAGVDLMTQAAAARGRICMVAIHASKAQVDLFQFFWRELEMVGARVYDAEDYDNAISLLASGTVDTDSFITDVQPLAQIQSAFEDLLATPTAIKSMIEMRN